LRWVGLAVLRFIVTSPSSVLKEPAYCETKCLPEASSPRELAPAVREEFAKTGGRPARQPTCVEIWPGSGNVCKDLGFKTAWAAMWRSS
jgi:hypothetical protein